MTASDRLTLSNAFLQRAGWAEAHRAVLAGDASNRRYDRLTDPRSGARAVLMDAPADKGEDVRPFIAIARHLLDLGFSAPRILSEDTANGFLLLEDLGDDLYARLIERAPAQETPLYQAAVDLLAELHQSPAPTRLAPYDATTMADLGALPFDWYVSQKNPQARAEMQETLKALLNRFSGDTPVMVLRDFHAENLLWLPARTGAARVGLLDFQDARAGHAAYDLVSLLEDARRDVPPDLQEAMLARYIRATKSPEADFRAAYACLGAQRNLRILGVFARLCVRDGKQGYVDLIPRVWAHLMNDLSHPELSSLREQVRRHLPPPDDTHLQWIKSRCASTPTQ